MPGHFERMAWLYKIPVTDLERYAAIYLEAHGLMFCRDFGYATLIDKATEIYTAEIERLEEEDTNGGA